MRYMIDCYTLEIMITHLYCSCRLENSGLLRSGFLKMMDLGNNILQTYNYTSGPLNTAISIRNWDRIAVLLLSVSQTKMSIQVTRLDYKETEGTVEVVWDGVLCNLDDLRLRIEDLVLNARGSESLTEDIKDDIC